MSNFFKSVVISDWFVLYCVFILKLLDTNVLVKHLNSSLVLKCGCTFFVTIDTFYLCIANVFFYVKKAKCIMQHFVNVRFLLSEYTIVVLV